MVKRWLQVGVLVLVIAAAVVVLVAPSYSSVTSSSSGGEIVTTKTALEVNGPWLVLLLLVPIAIAALPLFARGRAWVVLSIVSASLLWVFVILGSFTIGVLFAPAALLALVAACLPVRARDTVSV
jgi:hypothetical protein